MPDQEEVLFGELALQQGAVSEEQLTQCLLDQKTMALMGINQPIGEIMVGKGYLKRKSLRKLLREQQKRTGKQILVGRYEMISKIGGGGFGDVYKAKITGTDEIVAVKVLPPELARNKDYVARFRREAKVASRLRHPNIVRAIGMGKSLGYYYFAMEYVEGETAAKRIDRKGSFPEAEALAVVHHITQALCHAHDANLVHRDIKPDNIFLTTDGGAKLGDLGLARFTDDAETRLTLPGTILGSVYYISPEQARGDRKIDIRSDIYSLGASLYHMATGQVPFEGTTLVSILSKHQNEKLPWPAEIKPELSDNLCRLVASMMAKDPADRYQTPAELLADVDRVLKGKPPARALPAAESTSIRLAGTTAIVPPPGQKAPPAQPAPRESRPAPAPVPPKPRPMVTVGPPRVRPSAPPGPSAPAVPGAILDEPAAAEDTEPLSGNVGKPLPARPPRRWSLLKTMLKLALGGLLAGSIAYAMFPPRMKAEVRAKAAAAWHRLRGAVMRRRGGQ